jgi:hypothetical protein
VVAQEFVKRFETEYKLGAYRELHKKKYQEKQGALKNPRAKKIISLATVKAALRSKKTPARLKEGLLRKYGHLL